MANETKTVCGGFIVGEGLNLNGKVLSSEGGGIVVECNVDAGFTTATCAMTAQEVYDLAKSGKDLTVRALYPNGSEKRLPLTDVVKIDSSTYSVAFATMDFVVAGSVKMVTTFTIKFNTNTGAVTANMSSTNL